MRKHLSLLLAILMIAIAPAFSQKKETRKVDSFTKISFRVPGKLYVRQGNSNKVELEGTSEILSIVETNIEGSSLVIQAPRKWNWRGDDKVTVYITIKDLEGVSVGGSGDVIGESRFSTKDLALSVSGSGSMKLEVEAGGEVKADVSGSGDLQVKGSSKQFRSHVSGSGKVFADMLISREANFSISGSGRIEARGKAEQANASISGSGRVLGADLEVNKCEIRISGSGNVEINVKDELDANISGSGSVSYRGNPSKVNSSSSGSGRVRKM